MEIRVLSPSIVAGVLLNWEALNGAGKVEDCVGAKMNNPTNWLIVFVALTAFALLVQAIVMAVAYFTVRKTITTVQEDLREIRSTVMPMLTRSKEILERVAPKVESVAADVADMAQAAKEQTAHLRVTADEILSRVQRQTSRVDNMLTSVVDGVEHASNVVSDSVARPVRQVTAMLASAKAFISVLATGRRSERSVQVVTDQDMFV